MLRVKPRFGLAVACVLVGFFPAPVGGQVSPHQIDAAFAGLKSANAPGAAVVVVD